MLAKSNFPELVQLLVARHDVEPNAVDNVGRTPLGWASAEGYISVVRTLLQHSGVSLNAQGHGEYTPLWLACRAGRVHIVEILLQQNGVDVTRGLPRCSGRAPLEPFPSAQLGSNRSKRLEFSTDDSVTGAEITTSITGFFPPVLEVSVHAGGQVGHTMEKSSQTI